jgi:hypothetical protein
MTHMTTKSEYLLIKPSPSFYAIHGKSHNTIDNKMAGKVYVVDLNVSGLRIALVAHKVQHSLFTKSIRELYKYSERRYNSDVLRS